MSKDLLRAQELRPLIDRYISEADDPAYLARHLANQLETIACLEEKLAAQRRIRRTPSGTFAGVGEALSRAKTEAHNPLALLEEARAADAEHRPTPVVPDPRREQ